MHKAGTNFVSFRLLHILAVTTEVRGGGCLLPVSPGYGTGTTSIFKVSVWREYFRQQTMPIEINVILHMHRPAIGYSWSIHYSIAMQRSHAVSLLEAFTTSSVTRPRPFDMTCGRPSTCWAFQASTVNCVMHKPRSREIGYVCAILLQFFDVRWPWRLTSDFLNLKLHAHPLLLLRETFNSIVILYDFCFRCRNSWGIIFGQTDGRTDKMSNAARERT